MDKDAAATVADLILTSTQKGPGTVVPDTSPARSLVLALARYGRCTLTPAAARH